MVNPVDRDEITGHMWNRERHDLTRQELYDLVWSEPVYKVAERYAISGVALAKKCRNFGIFSTGRVGQFSTGANMKGAFAVRPQASLRQR